MGNLYLKPFPNFPNRAGPIRLVSFGKLGNWEMDWARFVYKQRVCLKTRPWGTNQYPNIEPMSVYKRKVCLQTWVWHAHRSTKCSLLLKLILTLILLLILVDLKTHVDISVSHDANLGARFSLFITNTTANRNCDA